MVAMDLVKARDPYTHDPALRDAVVDAAFHHGLLLLGCGESAVRFCPPLCITAEQVEKALSLLAEVLADVLARRRPQPVAI
jgi:4-aminobutyrate aminotransferase